MSNRHVHAIAISPSDIDFMGHVNNAVYLQWVQDAVIAHWQAVAPDWAKAQHLWIALRHEVSYLRPTFLEDTVVAIVALERTWGARAYYRTKIERNGKKLADVISCWCSVDPGTHRPRRLSAELLAFFGFGRDGNALERPSL